MVFLYVCVAQALKDTHFNSSLEHFMPQLVLSLLF